MKRPVFTPALLIILLIAGCGTIIHGTTQELGVTSNPAGATVTIDGLDHGSTPVAVELSRKEKHALQVSLDGYQPFEMIVNRKVSGWVWGNIIFGGLVGLAVDAVTGGLYRLDPEQVDAQLSQNGAMSVKHNDGELFITVVLTPDPEWERVGSLTRK